MSKPSLITFQNLCTIRVPSKVHMPDNPDGMCGFRIDNHPLDLPIIGEPVDERARKLVEKMGEHVYKQHPEVWNQIAVGVPALQAFMIGRAFQIQDPNAQQHLGILRQQLLMMVGRVFITDQQLSDLVSSMALEPEVSSRVLQKMQYIRNVLIEAQPAQQQEPQLVTP